MQGSTVRGLWTEPVPLRSFPFSKARRLHKLSRGQEAFLRGTHHDNSIV